VAYGSFADKFIHPLIIYVFLGTIVSYLIGTLVTRLPFLRDSRSRGLIYSIPLLTPLIAYFYYRPFVVDRCSVYGHPLGAVNDWLCLGGEVLASIMTPVFILVSALSVTKAFLSLIASRRIINKHGFASPRDYPKLFSILEDLCRKANIKEPRIVVARDAYIRSFALGLRRPVLIFSQGLLNAMDEDELETVVAHELAHVARGDSLLTWFAVFLRDFMFFTPVVIWVFRDLALEREKAADDIAISLTGKPMAFAQALIKAWKLSPRSWFDKLSLDNFMPHPNFASRDGVLEYRVKRILNNEHGVLNNPLFAGLAFIIITFVSVYTLYWFC